MVESSLAQERVPVVLGGDHSIAVGTIAGLSRHFAKSQRKVGVIWIDAHADMNTPETSPSGNVHGMPLACCIGWGPGELTGIAGHVPMVNPENVAIVGLRSVDDLERLRIRETGVHAFTMREVDERGMRTVMQQAIHAASAGTAGFHVSFDMDSVDPGEAPGVGTPVPGGLTYREAHLAMELIGDSGRMTSIEVVEVNPVVDVANRTAQLGVELIMSALGKRIL
jgi:arginase